MLSIKVNRKTSYFFLLLALLLTFFAFSTTTEASTPLIKSLAPANGSVQNATNANIIFEISDNYHEIANSNYYIKLDGNTLPTYLEYTSGYWQWFSSDGGG